jgi:uncharacterized UBP type Zn finger protein
MPSECEHLERARHRRATVSPSGPGCAECLASGDDWVHLRLCLTCGHVGCCDNSKNKHASRHFHETRHPVIRSYEPGEEWGYCFSDDAYTEWIPAGPQEVATSHFFAP